MPATYLEPGLPAAEHSGPWGRCGLSASRCRPSYSSNSPANLSGMSSGRISTDRRSFRPRRRPFTVCVAGSTCCRRQRGVGFAVRLLAAFQATIEKLNLLPDLRKFSITPTVISSSAGRRGRANHRPWRRCSGDQRQRGAAPGHVGKPHRIYIPSAHATFMAKSGATLPPTSEFTGRVAGRSVCSWLAKCASRGKRCA